MARLTQEHDLVKDRPRGTSGWIAEGLPVRLKVMVESVLAFALLLAAAPIFLVMAVLVRITSPGPVLYHQKRVGRLGKVFTIYKIRTMRVDSEPNGAQWCVPGDPRVTSVGRFLRWSHLDELPQLANIMLGEMSLIGPRPERPEIVARLERLIPGYNRRLEARPGLTGLSQVLQAPDSDLSSVQRKLHYDLYYLDHWSLWLDLRILFATAILVLALPSRIMGQFLQVPEVNQETLEEPLAERGRGAVLSQAQSW